MSRPVSYWRSVGFRWFAMLSVLLWLLSAGIVFSVVAVAEAYLLGAVEEEIDEHLDALSAQVAEAEYEPWGEADERAEARWHERLEAAGSDEQVEAALEALWARRESPGEAGVAAIDLQLWILGEDDIDVSSAQGFEAAKRSVQARVPAAVWPQLEAWADQRWLRAAQVAAWGEASAAGRLLMLADEVGGEGELCFELSVLGEQRSNLDATLDGDFGALVAARARLGSGLTSRPETCLMKRVALHPDGELALGQPATAMVATIEELHALFGVGLLGTLVLSLLLAALLGSWQTRRLRQITSVTDAIIAGQLDQRVPVPDGGDEFDRLGSALNGMLDHLDRLMRSTRDISDNIAHDLRTPLTRLRNRIEFLSQQEAVSQSDVLDLARDTDHMLETFQALLRIAQLEQGGRRQDFERFDLVASLTDVQELYQPVFEAAGIMLKLDLRADRALVMGDRDLWMQVLSNLLENILQHAPASTTATLVLSRQMERWLVEVRDGGPGVPEDQLDKVLERFYRVDSHRGGQGTGLGLAMVGAICQAHGVDLRLANEDGLVVRLAWPG